MASSTGWNVRGIDPEVREMARSLAYRSGLTLGEWLSRIIAQDATVADVAPDAEADGAQDLTEELGAIAEALRNPVHIDEVAALGQAPGATDPTIAGMLARIEASERAAHSAARQIDNVLEEVRQSQEQVDARLRWMEDEIERLMLPAREKEEGRQREAERKLGEKLDVDGHGGPGGGAKPFGRGRLTMKHFVPDPESAPWAQGAAQAEPEVMFNFVSGPERRWVAAAEPADAAAAEMAPHDYEPEGLLYLQERVDEPVAEARPSATRSMIEQARAAARAAEAEEAEALERKRSQPRGEMLFAGFASRNAKAGRKRGGLTLTNALFMSAAGAALGMSFAGYELAFGKPEGALPVRVAEALEVSSTGHATARQAPGAFTALNFSAKLASLTPSASTPQSASTAQTAKALYTEAVSRIEAHDFAGVEGLRKSAAMGDAGAQFYLSRLYETGQAGLKKDPAKARRWTERAAQGGDPKAMHNLGLYYFDGELGPKDTVHAAQWFRRAADLGVVDSQYNLGRLYEDGAGVSRNLAEAYKWYLIAAKAGDGESGISASRVKPRLSKAAQAASEHLADGFQPLGPRTAPPPVLSAAMLTTTGDSNLVTAQRALSRLGYYQGPSDGVASPALSMAIAAYQRDQRLPVTGTLDPTVNQGLSLISQ